jgi:hypothetical protein
MIVYNTVHVCIFFDLMQNTIASYLFEEMGEIPFNFLSFEGKTA